MKYYYDDHLAAAWMHTKFGMNFVSGNGKYIEYRDNFFWEWFERVLDQGTDQPLSFRWRAKYNGKLYIHSDSLYLLDIHVDDILDITILPSGRSSFIQADELCLKNMEKWGINKKIIIQRKGIPFISPEIEQ